VNVRWTRRAAKDLLAIGDFIARDKPGAARRWVARLKERARHAAPTPRAGRRVPELDRDDVREVLVGGYRIVYQIYPDFIDILTVFEGHRLFPIDALPQDLREDG
jgi:plasmid stabilization system protein ParE